MKQTIRFLNLLVACGLALAMVTTASAQSAKERTGKVVRIKGAARYSTGNNVWQPLKVGDVVHAGTIIQAASDSYVDISLGGKSVAVAPVRATAAPPSATGYSPKAEQDMIRIQADSTLALDKLSVIDTGTDQVTDTQLDLRGGRIFGSVKKLNASSRYEIKLPNGVAGIRGTVYSISADGVVQVLSGSVVISWTAADGTVMTQTVNGGYQFDARTGLVTPMSESDIRALEAFVVVGGAAAPGPTTFVEDNTVYFVSPDVPPSAAPAVVTPGE